MLALSTTMLVRPEQPLNAALPMVVRPLGISMLVSPEQSWNALLPMFVTLLGIVTFVNFVSK